MRKRMAFDPLVTSEKYVENDGSGLGNAIAILSKMVNTGIIMDELGMFPDDEALFESPYNPDTFGHPRSFIAVHEIGDFVDDDCAVEEVRVILDATAGGFSVDDHPDKRKGPEPRPVSWRMGGRRLKEYRLRLMKNAVFSRINYDPKRKWIVTGATPLPGGSKTVTTAAV